MNQQEQEQSPKSGLGGTATRPPEGAAAAAIKSPSEDGGKEPGANLPAGAPKGLKEAAGGGLDEGYGEAEDKLKAAEAEAGALDFCLTAASPKPFHVDTLVDTDDGLKKLRFHMLQIDGKRVEEIETANTEGFGPLATVNRAKINAQKVAEATVKMVDHNGKEIKPTDAGFLGDHIDPSIAFERMFAFQPGVGERLSEEIDRMAGMARDRVGIAEREMTNAVKNS